MSKKTFKFAGSQERSSSALGSHITRLLALGHGKFSLLARLFSSSITTLNRKLESLFGPRSKIPLSTNKLVNQHQLQKTRSTLSITGVGGLSTGPILYGVAFTLQSRVSEFSLGISAFSMDRIADSLVCFELRNQYCDHLQGLLIRKFRFHRIYLFFSEQMSMGN